MTELNLQPKDLMPIFADETIISDILSEEQPLTIEQIEKLSNFTVFNVSGNNYRLIALVDYQYQEVYIRHILTHAEYDKQNWKQDPWYT